MGDAVEAGSAGRRRLPTGNTPARWLLVPARGDLGSGPLVPAVRPVVRDIEEMLAEHGDTVVHVTVYRWIQRLTPVFTGAARPCRHAPGTAGPAMRLTSSSPTSGLASTGRLASTARLPALAVSAPRPAPARRFFIRALRTSPVPVEVTTGLAPALPAAALPAQPPGNRRPRRGGEDDPAAPPIGRLAHQGHIKRHFTNSLKVLTSRFPTASARSRFFRSPHARGRSNQA
jgi:hypothetical protein